MSGVRNRPHEISLLSMLAIIAMAATFVVMPSNEAVAQAQGSRTIELETIEIESEVPRRVAQFFVQRDHLNYQPIDDQPSFLPDLLKSVEQDPF